MKEHAHRRLGLLAVLHSALLVVGLLIMRRFSHGRFDHLWVGFATLWFLWPIVLVAPRGRSILRIVLPLAVSLVFMILWLPAYNRIAPEAFGLPFGVSFSPRDISDYLTAYRMGRDDARRDLKSGRLAVEVYGGPGDPRRSYTYLEKLSGVEVRAVARCVVDIYIVGHASGYNCVSSAEIKRRFGTNIIDRSTGRLITDASNHAMEPTPPD
jgi:hypothetical protein